MAVVVTYQAILLQVSGSGQTDKVLAFGPDGRGFKFNYRELISPLSNSFWQRTSS